MFLVVNKPTHFRLQPRATVAIVQLKLIKKWLYFKSKRNGHGNRGQNPSYNEEGVVVLKQTPRQFKLQSVS